MINPKVFISYTHDSQDHMDRVLDLSNRLRNNGINCNIDQYEFSPSEGWPRWMANQIEVADFVLVICTENYESRFKGKGEIGKGLGVKWEGAILTQELYDAGTKNTNFIPVIFSADDSAHIPVLLRGATHYDINSEDGYKALYRHLTNQPHAVKPELGEIQSMPPRERKQDFLDTNWNIPYSRNPFFTGRENVLDQLHKKLTSTKSVALSQPIAISGLGGIGKTQTAVEYAYRYRKEYKAVLWTKADSYESLISDYSAIAELLNLPEKNDQDQNLIITATKRWLEENSGWLLILDNADDPKIIEDFLPLKPKGYIFLTSRAQSFDNIGISNPVELEKMLPSEAKEFFLVRSGRNNLKATEIEAIESISQELDYLPLALEQAGAYISKIKCSFQDYLFSYRERGLRLLEKFPASTGKYPKSVATTWSLNFEQVMQKSTATAELLYASAFLDHDNIPFEIISQGVNELGTAISSSLDNIEKDPLVLDEVFEPLIQYSLIHRDFDIHTYSIHRLVQEVLKDRMDAPTQRLWSERVVKATSCAFPEVEFSYWYLCDQLLPHAQKCFDLIEKWNLESQEAATLLNGAGCYLRTRVRFEEAGIFLKRALDIREKILDENHPDIAKSLNSIAGLYKDQGKYAEAESHYRRALDIREKVLEQDHPDVAKSLHNLAGLYRRQGKYDEAEPLYRRALEIRERVLKPEHPDVATSLNDFAILLREQGKNDEAEPLYKRALDIFEKVLESDHPDVARCLNNLGGLYCEEKKYDEAEPLLKRALGIFENVLEPNHPDVAICLNTLAYLHENQGKYDEAKTLYRRSLEISEKVLGPYHPDVADCLSNLGNLYSDEGKYDEAEPLLKRALNIRENLQEPKHQDLAIALNNLAQVYLNQRKYAKAKPLFVQSIEVIEKSLGKEHIFVSKYLMNYANFLRQIRRDREAIKIERRAKAIQSKNLNN